MTPNISDSELPETLPVMPIRSTIVFPAGVIAVQVGMAVTLEMFAAYPEDPLLVALVTAPGGPDEPIDPRKLRKIGVLARVSDRLNLPGGSVQVRVSDDYDIRLRGPAEIIWTGAITEGVVRSLAG